MKKLKEKPPVVIRQNLMKEMEGEELNPYMGKPALRLKETGQFDEEESRRLF